VWSSTPSGRSRPSTSMSGRSTTGSKTACVPTSSSACSPIISNGTCASAWPPCSTTTPTRRPPRRSARARSQRLSDRPPPSPSRPPAEPTMVSPSTASTPCFTTSPPSPKTPSRPPSRPTSPSQSPHGRHTSRKKPPTSWASVPSNTPIQLDLIKLEQWVAKVERGKLRLRPAVLAIADALEFVEKGKTPAFSWRRLITQRAPKPSELRRFVDIQPVLDYDALEPGGTATAVIREAVQKLGLTPDKGVRVRLTGPVALSDEEFATVADGAALNATVTILVVILVLWLALKQARIILAVLINLAIGLTLT